MITDYLSLSPSERVYVQWIADRQKRQLELIRRYKAMTKETKEKETVQITPVTGVINNNSVSWLYEEIDSSGIDLSYYEHMANCPICNGYNEEGEELSEGEEEECNDLEFLEGGDYLLGYRVLEEEELANYTEEELSELDYTEGVYKNFYYVPLPDSEYKAIVRGDSHTTQVIESQYVMRVSYCSPCYPNQGDLDAPSSLPLSPLVFHSGMYSVPYSVYAYSLPPSFYEKGEDIRERIITLEAANRLVNYPGNREEGN